MSLLNHAHVVGPIPNAQGGVACGFDQSSDQRLLLGRDSAADDGCTLLPYLQDQQKVKGRRYRTTKGSTKIAPFRSNPATTHLLSLSLTHSFTHPPAHSLAHSSLPLCLTHRVNSLCSLAQPAKHDSWHFCCSYAQSPRLSLASSNCMQPTLCKTCNVAPQPVRLSLPAAAEA